MLLSRSGIIFHILRRVYNIHRFTYKLPTACIEDTIENHKYNPVLKHSHVTKTFSMEQHFFITKHVFLRVIKELKYFFLHFQ